MPPAIRFLPKSWRDDLLKEIGGVTEIDLNDPVARMIYEGAEYYEGKNPVPEQITPEQLRGWKMPVYVAMAANSSLHDAAKAVEVAQANIQHVQAKNWPGATHSLPMEFPKEINAEILAFMDAVDDSK